MEGGRLIVLVAPSGGGKTSVIHRVRRDRPAMGYSVSCTTRPRRRGELDGRDYTFLDEATFREGIASGRFVEWAEVHGHLYGTPREPLDRALAEGRDVMLDLDVAGALAAKKMYGDRAVTIFLLPPSVVELEHRLEARGTEAPEALAIRLHNALNELSFSDSFDHRVVNDDLDRAVAEIERILDGPPDLGPPTSDPRPGSRR
jgi:guanylate kinase